MDSLTDHMRTMAITSTKTADVMLELTKCSISRSVQLAKALLSPYPEECVQLWL